MDKNLSHKFRENSATNQSAEENSSTETKLRRRLQDGITSKNPTRKMNLDRRTQNSERRVNVDSDYAGPARRFTVDRRLKTKDRREKD